MSWFSSGVYRILFFFLSMFPFSKFPFLLSFKYSKTILLPNRYTSHTPRGPICGLNMRTSNIEAEFQSSDWLLRSPKLSLRTRALDVGRMLIHRSCESILEALDTWPARLEQFHWSRLASQQSSIRIYEAVRGVLTLGK